MASELALQCSPSCIPAVHIISFCVSFLSRVDELNKLASLQCMGLHSSAGRAIAPIAIHCDGHILISKWILFRVSASTACEKVNTMDTDKNLFRLVPMPGAQELPLELVPVPRQGAEICAPTKGYAQTGSRQTPGLNRT